MDIFRTGETYKDASGRSVRIICTDKKGDYSVVGLAEDRSCGELVRIYSKDGKGFTNNLVPPFGPGEYLTRDDSVATVLGVLDKPLNDYAALVGYITHECGSQEACSWRADGSFFSDEEDALDLIGRIK
jgi:hypothetical protein